jgi:hypothetical protein
MEVGSKDRDLVHPEVSSTPKTETDVYIAYRAAVARWPAARITLRQGARVVYESGQWQ